MPYTPFPILDMKTGKYTRRDPWLAPQDAFETLSDCHIKRGVLEKRRGYVLFGQILAINTATLDPALQTNPVMGIFNHLSGTTENFLVADRNRINEVVSGRLVNKVLTAVADQGGSPNVVRFTSTGHLFAADEIITITGDADWNGTYRIEAATADTFDIEHAASDTVVESGTIANQEVFSDLTKNKIRFNKTNQTGDFSPGTGAVIKGATSGVTATVASGGLMIDYGTIGGQDAFGTIVFDKGTVSGTFQAGEDLQNNANAAEIVGKAIASNSDEAFTGDNTNFFWTENWNHDGASDITYITNNKNPIQIYNGIHLRQLSIDIGTDVARAGVNDVNSCLLIIVFKERVITFSTNERGVDYFQRARWSDIKQPFSWSTANFKDAPTSDIIKSVDFIGDELYVWFERSTWRFTWTGDSTNPFEWERVSDTEGSVAQMSLVTQDDRQFAVGAARIQLSDGRDVVAADSLIPDFVLDWNQDSLPFSNSILLDEERHILMTYTSDGAASDDADQPDDGNVYPDRAVVINYEDNNFATYGLPIHTMGFSNVESDITWDDITDAWDDIDFAWNVGPTKSGFPTTYMGNHAGKIFVLNSGDSDDTSAIEFNAISGEWNPYTKLGHRAKLGYLLFLVDVDASVTFDVLNYINNDSTAFQTKTVTCTAVRGSDDKAWHRVDVFATADFHRIEITNNATNNRPRIHAIIPFFQDVGGMLN
jgi:hypothetical protein